MFDVVGVEVVDEVSGGRKEVCMWPAGGGGMVDTLTWWSGTGGGVVKNTGLGV